MNQISCDVIKRLGVIYRSESGEYSKEVNIVSFNGSDPKLDIRRWKYADGKAIPGKGLQLSPEEAETLLTILNGHEGQKYISADN